MPSISVRRQVVNFFNSIYDVIWNKSQLDWNESNVTWEDHTG
jgi:hypothetical protein